MVGFFILNEFCVFIFFWQPKAIERRTDLLKKEKYNIQLRLETPEGKVSR